MKCNSEVEASGSKSKMESLFNLVSMSFLIASVNIMVHKKTLHHDSHRSPPLGIQPANKILNFRCTIVPCGTEH